MISRLRVYEGQEFDPYYNLAVEQMLLETMKKEECILYLWQNRNTVVIGRNQNAWKECRIEAIRKDHVCLARRVSGGGAVYHDPGNLNFTFLTHTEDFNIRKQAEVILRACQASGVDAMLSGRNDMTLDGRKFSGNAFYHHLGRSFHHGTLLVNSDLQAMERYLRPSEEKIRAKGVDSVRSRVVNLSSIVPSLTIEILKKKILQAFEDVYELPAAPVTRDEFDMKILDPLFERNKGDDWNYGQRLPFHYSVEKRFSWGGIRLEMFLEDGRIRRCSVSTDAMDPTLSEVLEQALNDCPFDCSVLCARISGTGRKEADDICRMLQEENL